MLTEKRIKVRLFEDDVTLDYGIRFSARLRKLYPNIDEIFASENIPQLMITSVVCGLPDHLHHKTESEVVTEIDNLDDPLLLYRCFSAMEGALGFFAKALKGPKADTESGLQGAPKAVKGKR